MAEFAVRMHELQIEDHPNADRLEIAKVLGYTCVVPKGEYSTGDLAAYIPEMSIVPDAILEEMGLEGRLAGKDKNRVRAQRLRGILSQGLVYSGRMLGIDTCNWEVGEDVTEQLGITKYEPPIPSEMRGALERYGGKDKLISYDVENVKKYPDRLKEGEQCSMHEKIHGSLCYVVIGPDRTMRMSSKGRASSQLVFADSVDNIYTRMCKKYEKHLQDLADWFADMKGLGEETDTHILCEVYGSKVQDLAYGKELDMAVFDVMIDGKYMSQDDIQQALVGGLLQQAPCVYVGPFSEEKMNHYTSGPSFVNGANHMREGVVIRPVPEREDADGRVMLKSVSPEYLTRKGGTEYN